jgi:hypothetical protein
VVPKLNIVDVSKLLSIKLQSTMGSVVVVVVVLVVVGSAVVVLVVVLVVVVGGPVQGPSCTILPSPPV